MGRGHRGEGMPWGGDTVGRGCRGEGTPWGGDTVGRGRRPPTVLYVVGLAVRTLRDSSSRVSPSTARETAAALVSGAAWNSLGAGYKGRRLQSDQYLRKKGNRSGVERNSSMDKVFK